MRHFEKLSRCILTSGALFSLMSAGAWAEEAPLKVAPGPDLGLSLTLAQAALADCQARGFSASASVVDSAGLVKVTLRADGAPKPPVAAPRKAATAAAFDQPGTVMQVRETTDAAFAAQIKANPEYNDHAGSLPLHSGGVLIGGLAVADVPHDVADLCARAALSKSPLK